MTDRRKALAAYAGLLLVMLFWAGNAIVGRAVRDDIAPFTLAFLRWALASLLLLPFAARQIRRDQEQLVRGWKMVLILGVLGVGCFNGFLYLGLHYTGATNALLLQAAIPAGVLLADRLLFGQSAPAARLGGVLLSTIGVIVVVVRGDVAVLAGLRLGRGDLLVMAAVTTWALYTSLLRRKPPVQPLSLLTATFLICTSCMAPFAAAEWIAGDRPAMHAGVLAAIAYVAIFPSIVSYLLYNDAVARIGAGRAGQMISLMPLFGAAIAAVVLGEELHTHHLVGMALIGPVGPKLRFWSSWRTRRERAGCC